MLSKRKKILLVDDEEFIRKLTRATLISANYEIQEAENGRQALKKAREIQPDLILLDVTMPGISGYEVCKKIKEDPHLNTHIVMLTGNTEEWVKEKGIEAGADDFFLKPFSPIQLLNKVHSYFYKESTETDYLPLTTGNRGDRGNAALENHRIHTREELSKLENDQLMLYAIDLSKIYQNEFVKTQELNKAYEKLKEMEKMKDIFIALVSHELRTPLSIIKGYLYLLQEVLNKSSIKDDISGFLTPIFKATDRLEELMGELLDFSRMKSGLMTFKKREIHIPSLLNLIMEDYQSQFDAKKIKTNVEFEGDFRPIKADYERLKEALSHFVHNALNFTDPGGKFDVRCRDEGIWVVVEFEDTGRGIPDDKREKVFSPFYQVADFLTRDVGGMGLGLSIAKHVVEDHGGSVSLESQVGKGSKFTVKLPRSYQDAREIVAELKKTYPKQIEELSRNLKATQEQLLAYAHELSEVFARERKRSEQLEETLNAMEKTYVKTIAALSRTVDIKDAYIGGHTDRVAFYARTIAKRLNPELLHDRNFKYSLLLHDIGKTGVAEQIMGKVEKLTDEEWQILRGHPEKGVEILKEVEFLAPALRSVRSHHERWNGKGYPDGLKGEEIPLVARIIAVADSFDAMTTNRPYRKGMSLEKAKEEIIRQSGQQFDPEVVNNFLLSWDEIKKFAKQVKKILKLEKETFEESNS